MKILHTSDWHLGQKLAGRDRDEEHRLALDWLASFIKKEQVDVLIVAGDVFDIHNPPNCARELYYSFLRQLIQSQVRHVVVIGGNHDSANMLEAPKALLKLLGIHVVGAASDDLSDEIIELRNDDGDLELVVAAVPFLRDQDLRKAFAGETTTERYERVREAIKAHYQEVSALIQQRHGAAVPVIATGHLYATGATSSAKQDNIYLGNLENISAEDFPDVFSYVALGHIHRPQAVGGFEHIRYCGSVIPLSFSETKDDKLVALVELERGKLKSVKEHKLPVFRRLKTIEGKLNYIKERLQKLHNDYLEGLSPWVELVVDEAHPAPGLADELRDFAAPLHPEILAIKLKRQSSKSLDELVGVELDALSPEEVFLRLCEAKEMDEDAQKELLKTYRELLEWVQQNDEAGASGA